MCVEHSREGFPLAALREVCLLSKLRHSNVVSFLEVAYSKYSPPELSLARARCLKFNCRFNFFMVSEYMEHSLRGLLNRNIIFNLSQIKYIVYEALQGLHFIHSNRIIHRDIKSSNILINSKGEVKLADFGLSIKFSPDKPLAPQTVATRWYRAPELLQNGEYNQGIDIWALGCVFTELLNGELVFRQSSPKKQLESIGQVLQGENAELRLRKRLANCAV